MKESEEIYSRSNSEVNEIILCAISAATLESNEIFSKVL